MVRCEYRSYSDTIKSKIASHNSQILTLCLSTDNITYIYIGRYVCTLYLITHCQWTIVSLCILLFFHQEQDQKRSLHILCCMYSVRIIREFSVQSLRSLHFRYKWMIMISCINMFHNYDMSTFESLWMCWKL